MYEVGKSVRHRYKWDNNIKTVLKETRYEDVNWISPVQDRIQ
jgi:hypothetical protein